MERFIPLASHIAQIVMMLLTAGGLFFTVIPLYQKAAVDEQIAKQQIKLDQLERQLKLGYRKIRANAVRQYVFAAGAQCTGLMLPAPTIRSDGSVPDIPRQILQIDVSECMRRLKESSTPLRDLTQSDFQTLKASIRQASHIANVSRIAVQAQMAAIDTQHDKNGPLDLGDLAQQSLVIMKKLGASDLQLQQAIHNMATQQQKLKLLTSYQEEVRKQIDVLNNIAWPEVSDAD